MRTRKATTYGRSCGLGRANVPVMELAARMGWRRRRRWVGAEAVGCTGMPMILGRNRHEGERVCQLLGAPERRPPSKQLRDPGGRRYAPSFRAVSIARSIGSPSNGARAPFIRELDGHAPFPPISSQGYARPKNIPVTLSLDQGRYLSTTSATDLERNCTVTYPASRTAKS